MFVPPGQCRARPLAVPQSWDGAMILPCQLGCNLSGSRLGCSISSPSFSSSMTTVATTPASSPEAGHNMPVLD
jgi:hypothetical protein